MSKTPKSPQRCGTCGERLAPAVSTCLGCSRAKAGRARSMLFVVFAALLIAFFGWVFASWGRL